MIRRNGKPTSCEPCRVSKVRCDHTTPVCRHCQSRGNANQCYYHPAPLTRAKAQGARSRPPARRAPKVGPSQQGPQRSVPSPEELTATVSASSDHLQFLGSTSYLSVFRDAPFGVSKASNRSLYGEFEHWRTDQAYASARLIYLVSIIAFHRDQISWYYSRGRFTIIPAPVVLDSLRRAQEHIQSNPWDVAGNWKSLYEEITAATATPLEVSSNLSPHDFYALFSGPRLRWEFIGFVFALAGLSVQGRYRSQYLLDLGNGETMDVEMFAKEMFLACNACNEICKAHGYVNQRLDNLDALHACVSGDGGERVYSLFGDFVSTIYAMGLHHQPSRDAPLFLSETRKRMLSVSQRTDKNFSTLMGRPPRLPHQYCDATLPLDLADDDLFLDKTLLDSALQALDEEGWNCDGKFHPATVMRIRHILSTLREQVLELSLGCRTASDYGDRLLKTYHSCQQILVKIPARFRYSSECWQTMDVVECIARSIIQFEYLFSILQLQRLRCQESRAATSDLLDTCIQVLSVVMDLTKQFQIHVVQKQFPWIFLVYGIPAAGVLVTEIHRHTLSNQFLPSSVPRSEIIRMLSVLIAWVRGTEMPPSTSTTACVELINVISRLLDDTLNCQPAPGGMRDVGQVGTTPGTRDAVEIQ